MPSAFHIFWRLHISLCTLHLQLLSKCPALKTTSPRPLLQRLRIPQIHHFLANPAHPIQHDPPRSLPPFLSSPSLILDIGCGSGLSGSILSSVPPEDGGPHIWIGLDISESMLGVALEREVEGDLFLADAGQGVPFRPGAFDAAISISAVQWLCNAESSEESAQRRLSRFFNGLYASLRRGGRAVCQFYPRNEEQKRMVSSAAIRAGFGAGLLEDDPGTKSAKTYLVLTVGGGELAGDITGLWRGWRMGERKGGKAWIMRKKEQMERKGKVVKPNSKYTGRKRKIAF
ncbi:18S rRNA (guanine1575-N7)-methyltransferase [Coniosporium tulheliwenetii]|uniref:18S rRNA (Guanine1575-N7)-methyltransferase n=1 Tax=Coniosporium tulheliwenetii TaxID=3383036 RepID=A0ACC2ZDB2_9PEZI|nr:18S rRNA (guanine1575-N7)-methyltransferase [Cladosporium sp. JES 115]